MPNPLERLAALIEATGDTTPLQWLSERSGGSYVDNPSPAGPDNLALIPTNNKIVQEFADMLSVIARAAVDSAITRAEAEKIRGRWSRLKSVTEGFVHCCEAGNFKEMHVATSDPD